MTDSNQMSPDEAIDELNKITVERLKDRNHPLNDAHHPLYKTEAERRKRLLLIAYPGAKDGVEE